MSVQIEKLENNMAKLTITVSADEFEKKVQQVYQKMKGRIQVPGFRKGKAPRHMIEKLYGEGIFFEDAANDLIPGAYDEALKEIEETIVSRPEIDVVQIGKGQDFVFTAEAALKPEVTLGQYKGLEIPAQDRTVTDEEVQAEIDKERESNARMIDVDDRPVEDGDIIKLDFNGTVDGVPFDGGSAQDYPLTIGSGSFIPGFEEQLIGKSIGEDVDVTVTFPADYQAEELQGKEAVFACRVNAIQKKELPELDDEFAQDVSEFDTLDEYRADVREKLQERKESAANSAKQNAAVAKAAELAQIDIPDAMIDEQVRRMLDDYARRLESQGISLDQYMEYLGMNTDVLSAQMRPEAVQQIRNNLVLEAVAKAENIEITDEKVDEEVENMAAMYNMEADKLKELMGEYELKQIRSDLAVQAAVAVVTDSAVEVEIPEEDTENTEESAEETTEE